MNTADTMSRPGKMIAGAVVIACLAIGAVGLVLPLIPGLLFLAIAVFVLGRLFPSIDAKLRKHRGVGKHLKRADGFMRLSGWQKVQVSGLYCVKAVLEGLALVGALTAKLLGALRAARR